MRLADDPNVISYRARILVEPGQPFPHTPGLGLALTIEEEGASWPLGFAKDFTHEADGSVTGTLYVDERKKAEHYPRIQRGCAWYVGGVWKVIGPV